MVNQREIEANPDKIRALLNMRSPLKPKEVQNLTGRLVALSRFISKCEAALQGLKEHLGVAPLLFKPKEGKALILYLDVSTEVVSSVLIRKEDGTQLPVYYVSKALSLAESRYSDMEKLAFSLITGSKKLRPYFEPHSPRVSVKGHALADFIMVFTEVQDDSMDAKPSAPHSGAFSLMGSPVKQARVLEFGFQASNNAAEFEAWLADLRLSKDMQIKSLVVSYDSQLVVSQVRADFTARDKSIASYLKKVKELIPCFEGFELNQIIRTKNVSVDALSKNPSMDATVYGLSQGRTLLEDKEEAGKLRRKVAHYILQDGVLYKRGFSLPLLRRTGESETEYVLRKIYEGICGNHIAGSKLAHKVLRQGYYWPTLRKEAVKDNRLVTSPWPFAKWGIHLIGPLPKERGGANHAVVAIDYFTKWVKVEPFDKITEANSSKFIWKNIICRFKIPHSIVSDNGKQFYNKKVR
ncbi:uncharacterized protein LOC111379689 [Olea europaea var. sylvestris]|uniref:uncharacterized protein LOC111379689 n=1 Tax=Olea europaea var. sylvestris TaxID=158386 RepID=UPI000C1D83B4|nr:uncharacterized protein LOC111379689 [Olea europaea var. sylvestris]